MHLSTAFTGLLALAPLAAFATPMPATDVVWSGYEAIPDTAHAGISARDDGPAGILKREYCGTGVLYNRADAVRMANNLQTINPNGLRYLAHRMSTSWTDNTARVCIYNYYLTENTHIKEWEVGWAMKYIMNMCCTAASNPQW